MKTRLFLRRFLFVCLLSIVGIVAAYAVDAVQGEAGPEPAPWWMRVEDAQNLAMKWLAALTVIGGALTGFVLFVLGKVQEIKARMEKQGTRLDSQEDKLHSLALNSTPSAEETKPKIPTLGLLIIGASLFLSGCVATADFLESSASQKILTAVSNAASASLAQSIGGGNMTPKARAAIQEVGAAAINSTSSALVFGLAELLRSKQATKDAATAKGVADAARQAGVPALQLPLSQAVAATAKTSTPDAANEAVAAALDKAGAIMGASK